MRVLATGPNGENPLTYEEAMLAACLDAYHSAIGQERSA